MKSQEKFRILVVDDEPGLADLLRMVLTGPGREVVVALDGAGCLREAAMEEISVLLLDLNLPDVGALDLIPRLRALPGTARTPILILSGSPLSDLEGHHLAQVANEVLLKPVSLREIKAKVDALLAGPG